MNSGDKSHVGMSTCYLCGETKEILLDTRLRNKLPHSACYDKEPCTKCKDYMKQGIIIISVRDGEFGDNPYRTGGWWVVKEQVIIDIIHDEEPRNNILKERVLFMGDKVCDNIGLKKTKE